VCFADTSQGMLVYFDWNLYKWAGYSAPPDEYDDSENDYIISGWYDEGNSQFVSLSSSGWIHVWEADSSHALVG